MQQAYYNNEPVANDLQSDFIYFQEENVCTLPTSYSELENNNGHYEIIEEADRTFLLIKTKNSIFNRKFLIKAFNKKRYYETGYYYVEAVLIADSLRLDLRREFRKQ